jgi:hypothetical protein
MTNTHRGPGKPLPFASKLSSLAASGTASPMGSPAPSEKKAAPF